jgi:uncharacterized protein
MRMMRLASCLILGGTLAHAALAGPLEDAKNAYATGDYDTAARLMQPLAAADDPEAQLYLGYMYLNGRGVEENPPEGLRLHRRLAEKGYAVAQYSVAVIYQRGRGVDQDFAEAAKWHRAAAEQGNALAQFALGVMHTNGRGVQADDVQAYLWIALALRGTPAGENRDLISRNLDVVREHMTADQFAEAERLIAVWQPRPGPQMPPLR